MSLRRPKFPWRHASPESRKLGLALRNLGVTLKKGLRHTTRLFPTIWKQFFHLLFPTWGTSSASGFQINGKPKTEEGLET